LLRWLLFAFFAVFCAVCACFVAWFFNRLGIFEKNADFQKKLGRGTWEMIWGEGGRKIKGAKSPPLWLICHDLSSSVGQHPPFGVLNPCVFCKRKTSSVCSTCGCARISMVIVNAGCGFKPNKRQFLNFSRKPPQHLGNPSDIVIAFPCFSLNLQSHIPLLSSSSSSAMQHFLSLGKHQAGTHSLLMENGPFTNDLPIQNGDFP